MRWLPKFLRFLSKHGMIAMQGGGQLRKEETPMSVTEVIALLMLVLTAIALGLQIQGRK